MGVKVLQCFPFYRRCKERCKGRKCPPEAGEGNYTHRNDHLITVHGPTQGKGRGAVSIWTSDLTTSFNYVNSKDIKVLKY
jgi:hypothetical protein